jgi:hypothetical protein
LNRPIKKTNVKRILTLNLLRIIALIVLTGGAGISLKSVLLAGRNNTSVLLPLLFAAWVLSPFISLLAADIISGRWTVPIRLTLYSLMLALTLGSLIGYSGILSSPDIKPAFIFLVVPLISWLIILIATTIITLLTRRRSQKKKASDI